MAELLPDRMGCTAALFNNEKVDKLLKSKRRQVSTITEWIQCFSIYAAVLTAKHPGRIQDLLGYQALIVEACSEYSNEAWLGYDRRFRQMAAANPSTTWAKIDPTLWNMAFTGQAKAVRCKFCFSLTHVSDECDWAPTARVATTLVTVAPPHPQLHPSVGRILLKSATLGTTATTHIVPSQVANTSISACIVQRIHRCSIKTTKLSIAATDAAHSKLRSLSRNNHSPILPPATAATSTTASSHTPKEHLCAELWQKTWSS